MMGLLPLPVRRSAARGIVAWFAAVAGISAAQADERLPVALENAKRLVTYRHQDVVLQPQPVLTTSNPTRGDGHEGSMTLWLNHGRPAVAVAIFEWGGRVVHEVDALARTGGLAAESRTGQRWVPEGSEVEFRVIPDVPPPSESAPRRRLELKDLAKLFSVTMLGFNEDNSDREELRQLPRAIYQYELDRSAATNKGVIDGAVFAFAQATDPEALLIIEAIEAQNSRRWEYALVRSTAGGLEGRLRGDVVFEAEKFPLDRDPAQPHFCFRHGIDYAVESSE